METLSPYRRLILFLLLLLPAASFAQWYNYDSAYNAGGLVSDRMQQAVNSNTGFYSTRGSTGAINQYGVFEHYGRSGTGDSAAFINKGIYDASANGIDYFYGPSGESGQQAIDGTTAPLFGALYLNNGSTSVFNLNNLQGVNVATAVYFNNGITTTVRNSTDAGSLRFLNGARYFGINTASADGDGRYVDGYVTNIGNVDFTFPVGQNGIQALMVDRMPSSGRLSVAYFASDPGATPDPSDGNALHSRTSLTAPISSVSSTGFWDWIQSGVGSGNVTVSVKIPDESAFASPADLRLVGWNGTSWVNLGGSTGTSGATRFNTLSGVVDLSAGITAIAVGSAVAAVLPVSLVDFRGTVDKECVVHLTWVSAGEHDLAHYNIEVSSDGLNFKSVGQVAAKNRGGGSAYTFAYNHSQDFRFTRLKIQDIGGEYRYSPVLTLVSRCNGKTISVSPNPATGRIRVDGLTGDRNTVSVCNAAGMQLVKIISHTNTQAIDMSRFPAGNYILKIVTVEGRTESIKIQKQ